MTFFGSQISPIRRDYSFTFGDSLLLIMTIFLIAVQANGQTPMQTPVKSGKADAKAKPGKTVATRDKIKRWFEFEQLSFLNRYHFVENANNTKAANNEQYQFVAKFRVKFDTAGKYSVAANLATGSVFNTFWNASGAGTGTLQKDLNFRQLFFDAKPVKGVEIQVGGLYVNYGESTEATTYDTDGYITGERIQLRMPKKLYFDEVSMTFARLAENNIPNVFNRFKRFDHQNYHQFLIRKQLNKSIGFSGDYTFESGIDTFHQAIKFKLPKKQIVDTFIFENYERVDPDRNYGFNIFGEKKLGKMFTLSGGFADIHIKMFNADRFPPGKRVYVTGLLKLSPEFSLLTQFTHGVGYIVPTLVRTRFDFTLNYNLLETLKRTKLF